MPRGGTQPYKSKKKPKKKAVKTKTIAKAQAPRVYGSGSRRVAAPRTKKSNKILAYPGESYVKKIKDVFGEQVPRIIYPPNWIYGQDVTASGNMFNSDVAILSVGDKWYPSPNTKLGPPLPNPLTEIPRLASEVAAKAKTPRTKGVFASAIKKATKKRRRAS
jgi:hypothetical protein